LRLVINQNSTHHTRKRGPHHSLDCVPTFGNSMKNATLHVPTEHPKHTTLSEHLCLLRRKPSRSTCLFDPHMCRPVSHTSPTFQRKYVWWPFHMTYCTFRPKTKKYPPTYQTRIIHTLVGYVRYVGFTNVTYPGIVYHWSCIV
jgi:hypothetical protein